jgi:hypothetical protein
MKGMKYCRLGALSECAKSSLSFFALLLSNWFLGSSDCMNGKEGHWRGKRESADMQNVEFLWIVKFGKVLCHF